MTCRALTGLGCRAQALGGPIHTALRVVGDGAVQWVLVRVAFVPMLRQRGQLSGAVWGR